MAAEETAAPLRKQINDLKVKNAWLTAALCLMVNHIENSGFRFEDFIEDALDESAEESGITYDELMTWKENHNKHDLERRIRENEGRS